MWHDLWVAFALLLVLEGIGPFLHPSGMRKAAHMISQQGDQSLRIIGFLSMLAGVGLLYLVN